MNTPDVLHGVADTAALPIERGCAGVPCLSFPFAICDNKQAIHDENLA